MKTYDLYMLEPHGDLVLGWHDFDAEDDDAAVRIADALAKHPPLELCRDEVLIKRWESAK